MGVLSDEQLDKVVEYISGL